MRIERGTVIADRYVVSAIEKSWLADAPDAGVVCLALDAILDVPVILYAADGDLAGDLLDAGRRLALVNDPRVPSVLAVGSAELEEGRTILYVVCERTAAISLAEVLSSGPIGPDEARAITGEVSEVLVHAGRRGLHHRCLGPESIGIMADGDVVVHGIAIDSALSEVALGLEVQTDTTALREDALAIVDILYACLTGQWPKPESRAGLPAAPRKNQRVVAIETLRTDMPEDLTAFLTGITSHSDPGPRSPGEIVRYLREWNRDTLADLEGSPLTDDDLFVADVLLPGDSEVTAADRTDHAGSSTTSGAVPTGDAPTRAPSEETETSPSTGATVGTADSNGNPTTEHSPGGTPGTSGSGTVDRDSTSTASTSAGAGTVGAKPTGNTSAAAKKSAEAKKAGLASSTIGMGKSGARPTTALPARPVTPTAPPQRQATPDQIQAALSRIGMTRPGISGYSAGRSDGVATKLDEQLAMREASVFPLSADDFESVDAEEWTPEHTYSAYKNLSANEYDSNHTAPILDRDALWGESEDVSTQQMPVIPDLSEDFSKGLSTVPTNGTGDGANNTDGEASLHASTVSKVSSANGTSSEAMSDDDSAWFMGGVFTTREEEVEQQRAAFERERALERDRAEAARRRVLEAEARTTRQRDASKREATKRDSLKTATAQSETAQRSPSSTIQDPTTSTATKTVQRMSNTGAKISAGPVVAASTPRGSTTSASQDAKRTPQSGVTAASAAGGGSAAGSGTGSGARNARKRRGVLFLVFALLVIIAIVLVGIFAFGGSSDEARVTEAVPTQEAPAEEPEDSEDEGPQGPTPVIAGVEAIDPEGDDAENSDQAENVLPGEPGGWSSERYNTPAFGGLKSGLGLAIELEEESLVSQLDFLAPDGDTLLEVRVGDSDDVETATTVASVELDGNVTVELDEPVTAEYVFIWFTEATSEGGGYRVMIDEVDIS